MSHREDKVADGVDVAPSDQHVAARLYGLGGRRGKVVCKGFDKNVGVVFLNVFCDFVDEIN